MGKRQLYAEGETIHKTISKHRILKIEKKHIKQEIKHKRMFKNTSKLLQFTYQSRRKRQMAAVPDTVRCSTWRWLLWSAKEMLEFVLLL